MAPVISSLSRAEEKTVMDSLLRNYPYLRVDLLEASPAVKEGENFMSVVMKVDVAGHDLRNGEKVNLNLIMKTLPSSEERVEMFHCDAASQNEAGFYSTVLPCLRFLSPAKLAFPPCLLATPTTIILRHLGQDGFKMVDRRQGLDLSHCLLVMQELGKFHAHSYALKHNNPDEFAKASSTVKEIFVSKDNAILNACVDNCIEMALSVACDVDDSIINKLESIRGNGFHVLHPLVTPSEPMAVITHGDLWSNNILFRYSSKDADTPVEACFLDLQGSRYASPALDILYFLFSSSRLGVLRQHFHYLLSTYQRALQDSLDLLAPSAPSITLPAIMDELKHHGAFGLVMSLLVLPVVTAEDIIINLDDVTEETLMSQSFHDEAENGLITKEYRKRVNENLDIFFTEKLI